MRRFVNFRFRSSFALAVGLLIAATAFVAAPVEAQVLHLFPCKIVCGYQVGNVRSLNDTSPLNEPYEDLKPGNYATTCNMFNYDISAPTQPVFPYVAVEGAPLIFLGQIDVASLTANAFGCVDLINSIGPPPPNGFAFEGYITFFTLDPDFRFDAVYSFESQNLYERHVLWSYDSFALFSIAFQTLGLTVGNITNPLPLIEGELLSEFAAASGAGGLGLGASIDVESIDGIEINAGPNPGAQDNLPPELRGAVAADQPVLPGG